MPTIIIGFFILLSSSLASGAEPTKKGLFSGKYKIECRGSDTGCPCYASDSPSSKVLDNVFHLQPLQSATGKDESVKKDESGNTPSHTLR